MNDYLLFSDGSVDNELKMGFGAYLLVQNEEYSLEALKEQVIMKQFENTSSTKLELQTLIWALKEVNDKNITITIYTDSQNITALPGRREYFEKNNYLTRRNKKINNAELYKEFYKLTDQLDCKLVKVNGHKPKDEKDEMDKIFALVDRATRKALRKYVY